MKRRSDARAQRQPVGAERQAVPAEVVDVVLRQREQDRVGREREAGVAQEDPVLVGAVAGHAGVEHVDGAAGGAPALREAPREGLVRLDAPAVGERIAEHQQSRDRRGDRLLHAAHAARVDRDGDAEVGAALGPDPAGTQRVRESLVAAIGVEERLPLAARDAARCAARRARAARLRRRRARARWRRAAAARCREAGASAQGATVAASSSCAPK